MQFTRLAFSLGIVALPLLAQEQPSKLSARQLFFTARPAAAPPAAPVIPEPPAPVPHAAPAKKAAAKKRPVVAAAPSKEESLPQPAPAPAPVQTPAPADATAHSQAVVMPYLGLRYTILQDKPGGQRQEVDPEKIFHSKERFYLSLESNDAAYLYVVLKASQGTWEVLFPNPDIDNGNNRLNARTPVLVPSPSNPFVFDENPGTEKLFIVLSRQPEADLNEMIRSVQGRQSGIPASDFERLHGQMVLASRGIAVEGVKKSSAAGKGETAVYMVNTNTENNSRVIADIVLKHE